MAELAFCKGDLRQLMYRHDYKDNHDAQEKR